MTRLLSRRLEVIVVALALIAPLLFGPVMYGAVSI
jgi:hypothetical protein